MMVKTICFGFDGICADMSFFISDLPRYRSELLIQYPWLQEIFDLLIDQGEDCELQFESTKFGFETFFDCIFKLGEISSKKTTHVGANSAIEAVTAFNLLRDPVYPIDLTKIYFLGNYSPSIFQKLPKEQRIPSIFLEYANQVKTSYIPISIIIPYKGRRGIISFGGIPSLRRIETLNTYMKTIATTTQELDPDFMALLGTTNVFATTTNFDDFNLLDPFLNLRCAGIDLGGTVGWDYNRLNRFYQMLDNVKIIMGNDSEFKSLYEFKFGEPCNASDPLTIYKVVNKLRKEDQIAICHTKNYQFIVGLESADKELIKDCMRFANKATVVKTILNTFPTAKQIEETPLEESSFELPDLLEQTAMITKSNEYEIKNPVGLGDVWTCTLLLGLLSQNVL